ncbi:MAG TPA: DnaD domain protein [Ktedonobacteraceae bacterium]|nr:DnaD domain protein [Ktedonobacteraceae bacterium]
MTGFAGFPAGKNPYVPVPEIFFTQLLPEIEDQAELKVTLHLFWLLARKQDTPRCTNERELRSDRALMRSLRYVGDGRSLEERLHQGLEQAEARGTLLRANLTVVSGGRGEIEIIGWYFFNTTRNQKIVAELQGGEVLPARLLTVRGQQVEQEDEPAAGSEGPLPYTRRRAKTASAYTMPVQVERPNIFTLFEQNIGLLGTAIVEEMKDALDTYPEEWIEAAIREAAIHNKRSWSYIRAILRRWETEGRQQWNA